MLLEKERIDIVETCKKLVNHNLTVGTGGNVSIYNREQNLIAISPSGVDYFAAKPEDVVIMDMDGNCIDSIRKPSSEWGMHKIFYDRREDINAVVHTHSTYCTAIATLRQSLPASNYLVAFSGYDVRCAQSKLLVLRNWQSLLLKRCKLIEPSCWPITVYYGSGTLTRIPNC